MLDSIEEIKDSGLSQKMKGFWLRALSAVELQNYDYAISLCQAVLKECPGFLDGRKLARKCAQRALSGNKQKKGGGMTAFLGGGVSAGKIKSTAKKSPEEALIMVETELAKTPIDPGLNTILFEIARGLGMDGTAAFALETVRSSTSSGNTKELHLLGDFYLAKDNPAEALKVFNDIVARDPGDMPAQKKAKDASANASMKSQNLKDASGMRELVKDVEEVKELESDNKAAMTRDQMRNKLAKLMEEYGKDNKNLDVVKEIAWIYEEMGYAPDSYVFYSWAYELSNGDVALKNKAATMKKNMADEEIRDLKQKLEDNPDDEGIQKELKEKTRVILQQNVDDAQATVDDNPTDPQLRFNLGKALFEIEDYSAAIPHLQQATRNPHIRTQALLTLAKTFKEKNMNDLAIKQLEDALEDLQAMDDTKKQVLYLMGKIKMDSGKKEDAIGFFKQIYEVDYGYLDVAKIVEDSYNS